MIGHPFIQEVDWIRVIGGGHFAAKSCVEPSFLQGGANFGSEKIFVGFAIRREICWQPKGAREREVGERAASLVKGAAERRTPCKGCTEVES